MFEVNGQMVNFAGEPVDQDGKVIKAEQPATSSAPISPRVIELQNDLNQAHFDLNELTGIHQTATSDLAKVTVERDGALAREKSNFDANQQLAAVRDQLTSDLAAVKAELGTAQARITELEGQLQASQDQGNPDSADTRTNAELRAALDAKGVQYDARLNKAALQALAAEHSA